MKAHLPMPPLMYECAALVLKKAEKRARTGLSIGVGFRPACELADWCVNVPCGQQVIKASTTAPLRTSRRLSKYGSTKIGPIPLPESDTGIHPCRAADAG